VLEPGASVAYGMAAAMLTALREQFPAVLEAEGFSTSRGAPDRLFRPIFAAKPNQFVGKM
jgi:hypothetical protein